MKKSGTLITAALLTFGIAAGATAAARPAYVAPISTDASAVATTVKAKKHGKKHSKKAAAPATAS